MNTTEGWATIGRIAKERRERLELNQEDLRDYGGPGVSTVGKFERGAQPNFPLRTQHQLENALGWTRGMIAEVVKAIDEEGEDWSDLVCQDWERSLVDDKLPDLANVADPGDRVRRAVDLSDAELLAELTYRFKNYSSANDSQETSDGRRPATTPARASQQHVLDELVRRGRNPGWLMDATGLELDELRPFLADGQPPSKRVAKAIAKALGWSQDAVEPGDAPARSAEDFKAELRRWAS